MWKGVDGVDGIPKKRIQHSGPVSIQVLLKLCIQIICGAVAVGQVHGNDNIIVVIHKSGNTNINDVQITEQLLFSVMQAKCSSSYYL